MSIPTILASGILSSLDLIIDEIPVKEAAIVAGFSFLAALAAMTIMWRLLNSISFTPYVIYRVFLGLTLLGLGYTGTLSL
jgi:undecaprenyl-diphosphatase